MRGSDNGLRVAGQYGDEKSCPGDADRYSYISIHLSVNKQRLPSRYELKRVQEAWLWGCP